MVTQQVVLRGEPVLKEVKPEVAVVACPDNRYQGLISFFLEKNDLEHIHTRHSPLGGSLNLHGLVPTLEFFVEMGVRQIVVFDHEDCKAYRQKYGETYRLDHHFHHIRESGVFLRELFPEKVTMNFYLLRLSGDIEEIE